MNSREVCIIRTGSANLASVAAALERLGARPRVTESPDDALGAPAVVLPGVGAFGAAMERLRSRGVDAALRERAETGRPLLAICLGMQLLCESSEESPGVAGLGVAPGRLTRFGAGVRVPQIGWNRITPTGDDRIIREASMYFANSYRLERIPDGWSGATSEHGGRFVAAIERGAVVGCQFHPEISGAAGLALLRRWLDLAFAAERSPC